MNEPYDERTADAGAEMVVIREEQERAAASSGQIERIERKDRGRKHFGELLQLTRARRFARLVLRAKE